MAHFQESFEEPKISRVDILYGVKQENEPLCPITIREELIKHGFSEQERDNVDFHDHHIEELSTPKAWNEDYGTLLVILDSEVLKYFQKNRNTNINSLRTPCRTKYVVHKNSIYDLIECCADFRNWEAIDYFSNSEYLLGLNKIVASTLKEYKPKNLDRQGSQDNRNGSVKGCFEVTPNTFFTGCSHLIRRKDPNAETSGILVLNLSPLQWSFQYPPRAYLEENNKRLEELQLLELSPDSTYSFNLPQICCGDATAQKYMIKVTDSQNRSIGNRSCRVVHQKWLCYNYIYSLENLSDLTQFEIADQEYFSDEENHKLSLKIMQLIEEHELPLKVPKPYADKATFPTVLHFACRYGLKEVIKYINQKFPMEFSDLIVENKHQQKPTDMIQQDDPENIRPLMDKCYIQQDYYVGASGVSELMNGFSMNGAYATNVSCSDKVKTPVTDDEVYTICLTSPNHSVDDNDDDDDDDGLCYNKNDRELLRLKDNAESEMRKVCDGVRTLDSSMRRIRELFTRIDRRVQVLQNEWIEQAYKKLHDSLHVSVSAPRFEDSYNVVVIKQGRKFSLPSSSYSPVDSGCHDEDAEGGGSCYINEEIIEKISKDHAALKDHGEEYPPVIPPRTPRPTDDMPSYPAPKPNKPQPKPRGSNNNNERKTSLQNNRKLFASLPRTDKHGGMSPGAGSKTLPQTKPHKNKPPAPPPQSDKPVLKPSATGSPKTKPT